MLELLQPSFSFFQELLAFKQLKLTLDTVLCLIPRHLQNCFGVCLFAEKLRHSFNCLRQAKLMLLIPASLKYSFKCPYDDDDDDDTFI